MKTSWEMLPCSESLLSLLPLRSLCSNARTTPAALRVHSGKRWVWLNGHRPLFSAIYLWPTLQLWTRLEHISNRRSGSFSLCLTSIPRSALAARQQQQVSVCSVATTAVSGKVTTQEPGSRFLFRPYQPEQGDLSAPSQPSVTNGLRLNFHLRHPSPYWQPVGHHQHHLQTPAPPTTGA